MPVWLISLLISVVASVGSSLLKSALSKPESKQTTGVRRQLAVGGEEPLSFILGRYGTPGYLEYVGTWGTVGGVPNAYLTMVVSVSDLPVRGLNRLFVNGEAVTIGAVHDSKGYPVTLTGDGGTPHMWIEFFDGTQTTADSLMLSKFSTGSRAWQSDMIGRGIAYARVTTLMNRELFNDVPDFFFEVDGIALNDPRAVDSHDNPVVMIHQILSGISYGGAWVWGLQDLPASRLPASLQDEMDKCDVAVAKKGGGTEPRFRAGAEIKVDRQPIEVIKELLETCNGRIAEIGGVYKILVAEPAAAVVSFTDDDVVVTETQSFEPFPGLESTYNAIDATYVEPDEKWDTKSAPQLRDTGYEADDDGRRLPASVSFPMVYSATQTQRLMSALLNEDRRFRTHAMTMLPEWWEYEVLDVAQWTSDRNGYVAKDGIITTMDDLPNGNQFIGWKEQESSDYDWDETVDEQDFEIVPLEIQRPTPQVTTGFSVAPYTVVDEFSTDRRAGLQVFWDAGLIDVRSVRIQVAESWGSLNIVADINVDYDPAELSPSRVISNPAILPDTTYYVRGIYLPFSGRVTRWSNQDVDGVDGPWLTVTTPNVADTTLGTADILLLIQDQMAQFGQIRQLIEAYKQLGTTLEAVDLENYNKRNSLSREISVQVGALEASFNEIIEVAIGPGGAIAVALESLYAAMGGNTSQVNVQWNAVAAPVGYGARYAVEARVEVDGVFRSASFMLDVPTDTGDPTRIVLQAGQTVFATSLGDLIAVIGDDGKMRSANDTVVIDFITGDWSLGAG